MVKPNEEEVVTFDLAYDTSLHTSGAWTGFQFATADDREQRESRYATRFASEVGATSVVVVGIDTVRGRRALVGSLVDIAAAREIRRASLALEPPPSEERVRALARFLAGDAPAAGLDVEIGAHLEDTEERTNDRGWMMWAGLGGVVAGAAIGGGLAIKFKLDADAAGAELARVCAVSCTSEQVSQLKREQQAANRNAIISVVSGSAVVATGVIFMVLSRAGPSSSPVAVLVSGDGAYASLHLSF